MVFFTEVPFAANQKWASTGGWSTSNHQRMVTIKRGPSVGIWPKRTRMKAQETTTQRFRMEKGNKMSQDGR
jgi:hypothetical protein